jgi:hypothetical protein
MRFERIAPHVSMRVPVGRLRPTAAGEALRFSPLVQAAGADASRVERVPFVSAVATPSVFFAGRPSAQRAADVWFGRFLALLCFQFAIQHNRL